MISNLVKGDQAKILDFCKHKVIEIESEDSESELSIHELKTNSDGSSDVAECPIFYEAKKECQFVNLERAITYSMIANSSLEDRLKLEMLRAEFKRIELNDLQNNTGRNIRLNVTAPKFNEDDEGSFDLSLKKTEENNGETSRALID